MIFTDKRNIQSSSLIEPQLTPSFPSVHQWPQCVHHRPQKELQCTQTYFKKVYQRTSLKTLAAHTKL